MSATIDARLAIHVEKAGSFGHRWIEYCRDRGIAHEIVNCYRSDVIGLLRGFDGLLWHFNHIHAVDLLVARHILTAAQYLGIEVFPNLTTAWHFDDKIAQKYVLEAINVPVPDTYVFYDKASALTWLRQADYPLVWKLRRGAGSHNVRLVRSFGEAKAICRRAFGSGFNPVPRYFTDTGMRVRKVGGLGDFWDKLRRLPRALGARTVQRRQAVPERGYVMFQRFMPDNTTDTRIAVIGPRAFGFIRNVRKNDFRASGSGSIVYDRARIDPQCVQIAFRVADALQTQSLALDFVKDPQGRPYVVDISYGFVPEAVHATGGYWDRDGRWCDGAFWPEHLILDDLLQAIVQRKAGENTPPGKLGPPTYAPSHDTLRRT